MTLLLVAVCLKNVSQNSTGQKLSRFREHLKAIEWLFWKKQRIVMGISVSWIAIRPIDKNRIFEAFEVKEIPKSKHSLLSQENKLWGRTLFDGWYLLEGDSRSEIIKQNVLSDLSLDFEVLSGYRIDGASSLYLDEWAEGNKLWSVSNDNKLTVTGIPPFELEGIIENHDENSPEYYEIPGELSWKIIGYKPNHFINETDTVDCLTWKDSGQFTKSASPTENLNERLTEIGFRYDPLSMQYVIGDAYKDFINLGLMCIGNQILSLNFICTIKSESVQKFLKEKGSNEMNSLMMFSSDYLVRDMNMIVDLTDPNNVERYINSLIKSLEKDFLPASKRLFENDLSKSDVDFFINVGNAEYCLVASLLIANKKEEASKLAERYSGTDRDTPEYREFLGKLL